MRKHKQTLDSSTAKRIVRRIIASRLSVERGISGADKLHRIIITGNGCKRRITLTTASCQMPNWLGCDAVTL